MKATLRDVWRGTVTTLGMFAFVVMSLVIVGLYARLEPGAWGWILILGGSLAAAGFWRGWKGSSLLGLVLGNVVAIVAVLAALATLPDPIAKITPGEILARFLYIPVCSAVLAALGFLLARLIRGRQREAPVSQLPRSG